MQCHVFLVQTYLGFSARTDPTKGSGLLITFSTLPDITVRVTAFHRGDGGTGHRRKRQIHHELLGSQSAGGVGPEGLYADHCGHLPAQHLPSQGVPLWTLRRRLRSVDRLVNWHVNFA